MIGLGLSAGIGHYRRIMAFQHIGRAAPFFYAQRVWAMLLSAAFFGELPDTLSLAGFGHHRPQSSRCVEAVPVAPGLRPACVRLADKRQPRARCGTMAARMARMS